jgi:hypothetical protein
MDPGYRSPLVDLFRRGDLPHDVRLLAAQGALSTAAHEQLALLVLLTADGHRQVAETAEATICALPGDALRAFLARDDVPQALRSFFAARGISPGDVPAADASEPLVEPQTDEPPVGGDDTPAVLSGLSITAKIKLASKGTREHRAQLIRDPNRIVAAAVLSSPKLTDTEVEAFAKMANVSEDVLRIIGTTRNWLKNYVVIGALVKNPKTPPAISMQLLPRLSERDIRMISMDRNVPEAVRLAARKYLVKGLR